MAKEKATREEMVAKFNAFLDKVYKKAMTKASNEGEPLLIDFAKIDKFDTDLSEMILKKPEKFIEIAYDALEQIELPNPFPLALAAIPYRAIRDSSFFKFIFINLLAKLMKASLLLSAIRKNAPWPTYEATVATMIIRYTSR